MDGEAIQKIERDRQRPQIAHKHQRCFRQGREIVG